MFSIISPFIEEQLEEQPDTFIWLITSGALKSQICTSNNANIWPPPSVLNFTSLLRENFRESINLKLDKKTERATLVRPRRYFKIDPVLQIYATLHSAVWIFVSYLGEKINFFKYEEKKD